MLPCQEYKSNTIWTLVRRIAFVLLGLVESLDRERRRVNRIYMLLEFHKSEAKIEALKTMAKEKGLKRELAKDEEIALFESEIKKMPNGEHDP